MSNCDFLLEFRLKELDPDLAFRHSCCVSLFEQMLQKFLSVFPTFTDHSLLHTLSIINLSNRLVGAAVSRLNADEIYIYLMSCALHDIGMGVSDRDFEPFIDEIGIREYVTAHPELSKATLIRKFHNDFSAAFVNKYWQILEIPNARYASAIAEVGRGHRKTDLMDTQCYPTDYETGSGAQVNLALLAALLRLADELDIASDRNPSLLYDTEDMENMSEKDVFEFAKHKAIRSVDFIGDTIVVNAETEETPIAEGIIELANSVNKTMQYCINTIDARSTIPFAYRNLRLVLNGQNVPI